MQVRVDRNNSAAALFCYSASQLKARTDLAGWVDHHWPGQVCDFTGSKASFDRQQHQNSIAEGMSGLGGEAAGLQHDRATKPWRVCHPFLLFIELKMIVQAKVRLAIKK
jgi:hypothetical protein